MIRKRSIFALAQAVEGVPVLGALDNSPAGRAGVRYGDILISVNGVRTRTVADYIAAKDLRAGAMEIVVFRDGAETRAELEYAQGQVPEVSSILANLITLNVGQSDEPEPGDPSGPS